MILFAKEYFYNIKSCFSYYFKRKYANALAGIYIRNRNSERTLPMAIKYMQSYAQ